MHIFCFQKNAEPNNWQGPWWSRSNDDDRHTYRISSSPDLLSSASPDSLNNQISPTKTSKSHILDQSGDYYDRPSTSYHVVSRSLNRAQASNSFSSSINQHTTHTVRKYTYSHADQTQVVEDVSSYEDNFDEDTRPYNNNSDLSSAEMIPATVDNFTAASGGTVEAKGSSYKE